MRLWSIVLTVVACGAGSNTIAAPRESGPRADVTFGRAGAVALRVPVPMTARTYAPGGVLDGVADRSGRVYVLVGEVGGSAAILTAYDALGRLDRNFGTRGALAVGALGAFRAMALDSAGRIIVLGESAWDAADPNDRGTVALRVLPDGRLDPAFGIGGIQRRRSMYPREIFSDGSDGSLVLATLGSEPSEWVVFRLGPDGMVDGTYGDNGVAVVPRIGTASLNLHTVDATGRFVALDSTNDVLPPRYALVGLDASGRPDSALGEQGTHDLDFGTRPEPAVSDFDIDAMGRYVVLGVGDAPRTAPFLARYLSDGTPDATWSGTADGVRELLTVGALPGTDLSTLTIDGASYYADGTRYDRPRSRDWGDSVVVRVDDGTEQIWTSRSRRFQFGLDVLSVRDGAVLALGNDWSRRHPRRVIVSLVRLLFD